MLMDYTDDLNFIVKLRLKQPSEELYLIKASRKIQPHEAAEGVYRLE
jgi:hypothetical protein